MSAKTYRTSPIKTLTPGEADKRLADALGLSTEQVSAIRNSKDKSQYLALVDEYQRKRAHATA